MVYIISKQDGPRREDVQAKQMIEQNRATITRLADQFSGGRYSASKVPQQAPEAEGLIIHVGSGNVTPVEARPDIRVSLNNRVIAVDRNSGRQLHHIGEIRHRDGADVFVLATKANGFFSPVDETVAQALDDLDGTLLIDAYTEDRLVEDIASKLGIS